MQPTAPAIINALRLMPDVRQTSEMQTEKVNPADFRRLLEGDATERQLHLYLRRHPWVLYWTVCPMSGHSRYILSGFPLGSRHKADFAILNSYSGAFEIMFVEL